MSKELIGYEVDAQNDFMRKNDGRLYVPGAEEIRENAASVGKMLKDAGIRRFKSRDRHFMDDPELIDNGGPFPLHCMDWKYNQLNEDGTFGIDFIPEVASDSALIVENKIAEGDNFRRYSPDELAEIARSGKVIIFEKQHYDVFTNPAVETVLKEAGVRAAIVYYVATEYCDLAAVVGMQKRGIQTYIVEDAISGITPEGAKQALLEMEEAGAKIISIGEIPRIIEIYGKAQ
ncbi:MAG: isochorismatase family cysteine hydrolase [Microgenomates group bacterium]